MLPQPRTRAQTLIDALLRKCHYCAICGPDVWKTNENHCRSLTQDNWVDMQCTTYSLVLQGIGDRKLTQIFSKSNYQIMQNSDIPSLHTTINASSALKLTQSTRTSINASIHLTAFFEIQVFTARSTAYSCHGHMSESLSSFCLHKSTIATSEHHVKGPLISGSISLWKYYYMLALQMM